MTKLQALAVLALIATGGQAKAQTPPEDEGAPEIVVNGERVPRLLRDTASSVVVATEDDLETLAGADRLDELLSQIPNLQLGSGGEGPAIRGQDSTGVLRDLFAFLGGSRPRVTLQVDGRAVSFNEYVNGIASIWDVERVEVFRSPQTTTQGRNSIAGAIFVQTNDPTYDWESRARAIVADDNGWQGSAVVSGPIVDDQLAIRLSGDVRLGRTESDMADAVRGADIDIEDFGVARVKFLAEPKALPGIRVETSYAHTESQAPQFNAVLAPFTDRAAPVPERTNGIFKTNVDSLTGLVEYRPSDAITSRMTLSYGDAMIRRFGLPGLGRTRIDTEDLSVESTVDWRPDGGAIGGAIGVHYLTTQLHQFIDITGLGIGAGTFDDQQRSLGLFGEATWRPVAAVALTAGVRYQRDSQDREGLVGVPATGIVLDYDESFDAWLPKVSVAVDLSDALTAGLLAQRAYNPGGTTISLATRRQDEFRPEALWNYEGFVRASFDGGRGQLSGNLFYNRIRDAQRSQLAQITLPGGGTIFTTEIGNAPAAESYGLELQAGWRASATLSMRVGIGLLRTKILETNLPTDPILGKDFQRSPRLTAAAGIDWAPVDALRLSAQLRHNSDYFSDDANRPQLRIDGATVLDARAAYTNGRFSAFGYVRNAFDSFYLTYLFTPTFGTAGDPREFGAGVEARF